MQPDSWISQYHDHITGKLRILHDDVRKMVYDICSTDLIAWKRNQQLAGNGFSYDLQYLNTIQYWCECMAEITWNGLRHCKDMKRLADTINQFVNNPRIVTDRIYDLHAEYTKLISYLVSNTFVIEKQPPQVLKTNTRFTAKIRLLVGGKLNLLPNLPQAMQSGEISNNIGNMEYEPNTKQLSITFRNLQLKKIKRAEKRGSESVVDEKFGLLFISHFKIGAEIDAHVFTYSLPVTVIVHGNQESHAWATITWDNAFAEPGRKPFIVPDTVTWARVAIALNMKFIQSTGKALTDESIKYLAEKLFV
ncbi:Signal transducer and activator of transcription 5B [Sarracenia purpurea var. burkii]